MEMSEFEEGDIRQALGILLTNTITIPVGDGSTHIMGLFPQYAMLNHSCAHNAKTNIVPQCKGSAHGITVELRARRKILRGEEITTRYLPINEGKLEIDLFYSHYRQSKLTNS